MKKFLSLVLLVFYLLSTNSCFAFSELYYLKNTDKNTISPQVENIIQTQNYTVKNKNPFYAVSNKKQQDYAVVVLQNSGENLFYYYESNEENKKLNKLLLKNFKSQNIVFEESANEMHLTNFAQIAQKAMTGQPKTYSFEVPAVSYTKPQSIKPLASPATLKGYVGKIARGASLDVYLQNAVNTATAQAGDPVIAVLKTDWLHNNMVVAPQGSLLYGSLVKANHASVGLRNGSVQIVFTSLVTPQNKTYNLITQKIDFKVTNEGKVQKTAVKAVVAVAVGALIGLGIAAICGGDGSDLAKGAIIGGSIAGGTALVTTVAEKGVDAEIPSFTDLSVILDKPIDVVLNY